MRLCTGPSRRPPLELARRRQPVERQAPGNGVRRCRPTEVVTLPATNTECAQYVEFGRGLDPLCDDLRPQAGREAHESRRKGDANGITVDTRGELSVQLDDVGRELEDMGKTRKAGTGVVDGQAHAPQMEASQTRTTGAGSHLPWPARTAP